MHTCTDVWTLYNQGEELYVRWMRHTQEATKGHTCACNYAKGVEKTLVAWWICIYVLIHVHILTMFWDQKTVTGTPTRAHTGVHIFCAAVHRHRCRHGEYGGNAFIHWCIYTFQPKCGNRWGVTVLHTWGHTGAYMFVCIYAKGVEQMWWVRWTCIHVLMHVHILIKAWN